VEEGEEGEEGEKEKEEKIKKGEMPSTYESCWP